MVRRRRRAARPTRRRCRRAIPSLPPPLINNAPPGPQSEDCLVLNVWTPATDNAQAARAGLAAWRRLLDRLGIVGLV